MRSMDNNWNRRRPGRAITQLLTFHVAHYFLLRERFLIAWLSWGLLIVILVAVVIVVSVYHHFFFIIFLFFLFIIIHLYSCCCEIFGIGLGRELTSKKQTNKGKVKCVYL